LELLLSCHKLEKIIILMPIGRSDFELQNRYLATIKAIDPDVIEFRGSGFRVADSNMLVNESEDSD
jgi:hypothetical protein